MNVTKGGKLRLRLKRDIPLYGMLLPGALFFIIFKYVPMYGIVMAFQNFRMARGFLRSEWVGLLNFQKVFESAFFPLVLKNTIVISLYKIIVGFPAPILLALMLNEIRCSPSAQFRPDSPACMQPWHCRIRQSSLALPVPALPAACRYTTVFC